MTNVEVKIQEVRNSAKSHIFKLLIINMYACILMSFRESIMIYHQKKVQLVLSSSLYQQPTIYLSLPLFHCYLSKNHFIIENLSCMSKGNLCYYKMSHLHFLKYLRVFINIRKLTVWNIYNCCFFKLRNLIY